MRNMLNYLKLLFKLGKLVTISTAWFGWGERVRTSDHGTKTRCLTAWLLPKEDNKFYITFIENSN